MKLGQSVTVNGLTGHVIRNTGPAPIAKAADGTLFKVTQAKRGPYQKPKVEVRVLHYGEAITDWLPAKCLPSGKYLILEDKVFKGAELKRETIEVRACHET